MFVLAQPREYDCVMKMNAPDGCRTDRGVSGVTIEQAGWPSDPDPPNASSLKGQPLTNRLPSLCRCKSSSVEKFGPGKSA